MFGHRRLLVPKKRRSDAEKKRRFAEAIDQADRDATTHVILSHGHCLDGVGSVIVLRRALGDGIGVAYIQPNQIPKALEQLAMKPANGRTLIIADLSLQPNHYDGIVAHCARLRSSGWTIRWYDHHHKQWEGLDLDRLRPHLEDLVVNDDATESGASLVQQTFAPDDGFAKQLAETIRDRDLWWNKTPDSETLEFALEWMRTEDFDAHFVPKVEEEPVVDAVISDAADRQKAQNDADKDYLLRRHTKIHTAPSGDQVAVAYGWLPKNVGLHDLLQQHEVRVAINVRPNARMSIRSQQDWPICHLIARDFDGGGHPNASGATLGLEGWAARWYVWRRGKVARTHEVAVRALQEVQRFAEEGDV